jgi:hypothetical protein
VAAALASVSFLAAYALRAAVLVVYPWDWSPDEGLALDYARRLIVDPGSLYGKSAVPFPSAYGPLLPVLLAPIVALAEHPLGLARVLAFAWTVAGVCAVFVLVRRRADPVVALACAALALAPWDVTFWHMLVRVDGPMIALALLAAVPLLPARVARGADRLSARRLVMGAVLLLAAALAKPTALVVALPLLASWLVVDRGSALRLGLVLGLWGAGLLAILQAVTRGGFLWTAGLWAVHPRVPGQAWQMLVYFASRTWPVLALLTVAFGVAAWRRASPWREPALLLAVGALLLAPAMEKQGGGWNYLLPAIPAAAIAVGRLLGPRDGDSQASPASSVARPGLAAAVIAAVAVAIAATRSFPLPSLEDRAAAGVFYDYVKTFVRDHGGPILVSRPDLAYFLVHQTVEIEGTSYAHLAARHLPGTDGVLARLREGRYTLVVQMWPLPSSGGYPEALREGYRFLGSCRLGTFQGAYNVFLAAPVGLSAWFQPPADVRCASRPTGS